MNYKKRLEKISVAEMVDEIEKIRLEKIATSIRFNDLSKIGFWLGSGFPSWVCTKAEIDELWPEIQHEYASRALPFGFANKLLGQLHVQLKDTERRLVEQMRKEQEEQVWEFVKTHQPLKVGDRQQ